MTSIQSSDGGFVRSIERLRHEHRGKREPIALTSIVALLITVLGMAVLGIEYQNLNLALFSLFPSTSDGGGVSVSGPITAGSLAGIMMSDILLDKASEHWSERTHRRMEMAGIASIVLLILSAMVLMPSSVWLNNSGADSGADGGSSSWAYLGFACMLAAWAPMSLLSNFTLLQRLKPALQRIERTLQHDLWQRRIGVRLGEYVEVSGALSEVGHQRDAIPSDGEVTRQCAADLSATIAEVESELSGVVLRRKAAETASPEAPLAATDNAYLNAVPVEALLAHRDYLRSFTPEAVEATLTSKGA